MDSSQVYECDAAIIGGGFGGVAAALAACESGAIVILTEATDWIGGQVTSQLVSALDEHKYIETFGGTHTYNCFRKGVRQYYQSHFNYKFSSPGQPLNPGGGWVSGLCFEPRIALQVLQEMLAPHIEAARLRILLNCLPVEARINNGLLQEVTCSRLNQPAAIIQASYFLDATELGDLLPLAGVPYSSGAEGCEDTGEPHASADGPHPDQVQAFTCCFILENCPGEDHTIQQPADYAFWRDSQPFNLDVPAEAGGRPIHYPVFSALSPGQRTFWTYRRILDASQLENRAGQGDLALINWDSNDYRAGNLIDASPHDQSRLIHEAKNLSRAFLYWLQTEVRRDDGSGRGYPGLRLDPAEAGTTDGFAKTPYIRESRRMIGLKRVLEQDIVCGKDETAARARPFADSVGVGFYPIDVHSCCGGPMPDYRFDPTLPYQIPLGALVSPTLPNLIAAAKNLSVTHLTNGAYRLHPVEWNIGESAGTLAAFCLKESCTPGAVYSDEQLLHRFQHCLLERGIPIAWTLDITSGTPNFALLQKCLLRAPFPAGTRRFTRLDVRPAEPIDCGEAAALLEILSPARITSIQDILTSWHANPGVQLEGRALDRIIALLSFPHEPVPDWPSYLDLAQIIAPFL